MKGYKFGILLILLLTLFSALKAQPPQQVNADYQFKSAGADSSQRLPKVRAGAAFLDSGAVMYNKADSSIYTWTGHNWIKSGVTAPALPFTSVQFNNSGSFGGSASMEWNNSNKVFNADSVTSYYYQIKNSILKTAKIQLHTTQGDTVTGTRPYGQFWHTLDQSFLNPDGQIDAVYQWGYNQNGGGGSVNPNEAQVHYAIESHFQQGGIGTGQMEVHLESKAKNGDVNRNFSYDIQSDNGQANGFSNVDSYNWFGTIQSGLSNDPYMRASNDGHFSISGPTAQIEFSNTTSGYGQLLINPISDGGVNLTNNNGSINSIATLQIVPHNSVGGIILQANGTSDVGLYYSGNQSHYTPFATEGVYATGVDGLIQNTSTGNEAYASLLLSTPVTGTHNIPFVQYNNAGNNTGYNTGYDKLDSAWTVAYNSFNYFNTGVIAKFDRNLNVSIGPARPVVSAKLDVQSTTQGFLPPRMTTTQKLAISSPAEGLVVYDTTLHKLCVRTASAWETITSL